jgi:hypothetical protein
MAQWAAAYPAALGSSMISEIICMGAEPVSEDKQGEIL